MQTKRQPLVTRHLFLRYPRIFVLHEPQETLLGYPARSDATCASLSLERYVAMLPCPLLLMLVATPGRT